MICILSFLKGACKYYISRFSRILDPQDNLSLEKSLFTIGKEVNKASQEINSRASYSKEYKHGGKPSKLFKVHTTINILTMLYIC